MTHNQWRFGRNRAVMKDTTPDAEIVFSSYLATHHSGVNQTSGVAVTIHAPEPLDVWSQSGCKEGHFTLRPKHFRTYLASHSSGVTRTSQMALPLHAPLPENVWSKSGNNEGHFILEA
jgi:hypothetical protein